MDGRAVKLAAYAKVNFTLDVLSRRPDGFHSIATLMQTVSLADEVTLSRIGSDGIRLECNDSRIPTGEENLAARAARALLISSGTEPTGIRIVLDKRIPAQAGLGGGSSDAAAVLRGLNALLGLNHSTGSLAEIGASLGSDVPFFLHGGTASCRGKGEQVTPRPDAPELWFVIVKPELNISTAEAYRALDAVSDRASARGTRRMEEIVESGDRGRIIARMTNDFEQVVLAENMAIALLQDEMMMARARNARLCGSGSAVFGVAESRSEAEEIARIMRLKYSEVFVCRSVGREQAVAPGATPE